MTPVSETVLREFMVRKTFAQKTAFIDYLKGCFPDLKTEADKGLGKSRNLILGNISTARVILTAHYDTCARLPFPNFITPKNFLAYLGYQLLIAAPFIALFVGVFAALQALTQLFLLSYLAGFGAMLGAMWYVMMGGPANPYTANDNTSGVITLLEIYDALTPAQREQVAFVFFDNEENGLLGSAFFRKLHKRDELEQKLLLNFDCVSDGDHILFVLNKPAMQRYADALKQAFPDSAEKRIILESSAKAFYPSDQANFPVNGAVAALNEHKLLGLYMDKIHTPKDRCFDTRNIELLRNGIKRFLEHLEQ